MEKAILLVHILMKNGRENILAMARYCLKLSKIIAYQNFSPTGLTN